MTHNKRLRFGCGMLLSAIAAITAADDSPQLAENQFDIVLSDPTTNGLHLAHATSIRAMLGNVLFSSDSTQIAQADWPLLRSVAAFARHNPHLRIELAGYSDVRGSRNYNHTLSHRRVAAVAAFLVRNGVPRDRIKTHGFGEVRASANVRDLEAQVFDRRVSVSLSGDAA